MGCRESGGKVHRDGYEGALLEALGVRQVTASPHGAFVPPRKCPSSPGKIPYSPGAWLSPMHRGWIPLTLACLSLSGPRCLWQLWAQAFAQCLRGSQVALAEAVVFPERPRSSPLQTPHARPRSPPGWTPTLQDSGVAVGASWSAEWTATPLPSCGCSTGTM